MEAWDSRSLASGRCASGALGLKGQRRPLRTQELWRSWGNVLCGPESRLALGRRWLQGGAFRMSSSLWLGLGLDRPGLELGLLSRVPAKGWAPGSC